jgi:colicin import membrane protein
MSTVIHPAPGPAVPPDPDPFRYGWRYRTETRPDGTRAVRQVPLTLEDVLHPQLGDVIVENSDHKKNCGYLEYVLRWRLARDPSALVLADCGVYWDVPGLGHHSPDVSVIFGVRERRERWSSFDVAEQGVRPTLLIELTSPATRNLDLVDKVRDYHRAAVPHYVIVDEEREGEPLRVLGYRYTPEGYVAVALDGQGRMPLEGLGLLLGVRGSRVVLFDAASGEEVGDYDSVCRALEAEALARRAAEGQAAAERDRAQAEALARRAAEGQAAAERGRAQAEALARRAAEQRLRELEAEMRRLRGEG